MDLKVDFTFDNKTYRHYMNGHPAVLHCHHYMSLTTKLAEDMNKIGGTQILREVAEDSVRPLFDDYLRQESVNDLEDRLQVGAEYYSVMGMGKMEVVEAGENGGEVHLTNSHVDEGWIKKWGKHDKAINHFTWGYISAMFAAAFNKPARSYQVRETASIVTGDPKSVFLVKLK